MGVEMVAFQYTLYTLAPPMPKCRPTVLKVVGMVIAIPVMRKVANQYANAEGPNRFSLRLFYYYCEIDIKYDVNVQELNLLIVMMVLDA